MSLYNHMFYMKISGYLNHNAVNIVSGHVSSFKEDDSIFKFNKVDFCFG